MTHVAHYTNLTTEQWIESRQGRTDFLEWLAGSADDALLRIVRLNLIGWAPFDRIVTVPETREWIYELSPDHPAAVMLHGRFVEDWIGTREEHTRFHLWADGPNGGALCGGCWT